jgi:2-iminobutanoate/2-iminopropanoate deaminase
MREAIDTGLPRPGQPFEWATRAGGLIFTTHGPVQPDGTIARAGFEAQARLTLDNLKTALARGGATLADVAQVTVYLVDVADMAAFDRVYRDYFDAPYPTRASIVVAGHVAEGMRVEISAIAYASGSS